jgi:uncharacterized membrane protein YeaQ/YmgE (transglycosylase-associated protein family)
MNIVIWMLAGAALGWAAFSFLGFNGGLGMLVSAAVGGIGGILGGKMVAPMITTAGVPGEFSLSALLIASAVAAALLAVTNQLQKRMGD